MIYINLLMNLMDTTIWIKWFNEYNYGYRYVIIIFDINIDINTYNTEAIFLYKNFKKFSRKE